MSHYSYSDVYCQPRAISKIHRLFFWGAQFYTIIRSGPEICYLVLEVAHLGIDLPFNFWHSYAIGH
jgi:hypothetical protein